MHIIGSMDLGGAEKLTRMTIEGLKPDEFKLSVCCLRSGGFHANELVKKDYRVHVLLNAGKHQRIGAVGVLRILLRLIRLLRREKPDIVHSHLFLTSFLARVVGWLSGIRCHVVTMHRMEYPRIQPLLERALGLLAARYVTDSNAAAHILTTRLGVKKEKVEVIYNGIDTREFSMPPEKEVAKKGLGLERDTFIIGIVAHLYKEKGHAYLFESLARIREKMGDFRLLVIGDGYLRPLLEKAAIDLFKGGEVIFLGQRGDLANLLAAMEILVLPSSWEGFGLILAEAMYMRVPVITTSDGGGCAEVVEEGNGGTLVRYGDVDALGEALLRFRGHEQLRQAQGAKGRARVEKDFAAEIMVEKYADMYRRVSASCRRIDGADSESM